MTTLGPDHIAKWENHRGCNDIVVTLPETSPDAICVVGKAGRTMDVDGVKDQASFLTFLAAMRSDLKEGALAWESANLDSFLEAMEAWATDSRAPAQADPWRHAAELLRAGAFYE